MQIWTAKVWVFLKKTAKSRWKSVSCSHIELCHPKMKGQWKTPKKHSLTANPCSNSFIYETEKAMQYHTISVNLEGGHSRKGCKKEMAALVQRLEMPCVLQPYRFPSLRKSHGDPEWVQVTALLWVGDGRTASQDPTNKHFSLSISSCSLSKQPRGLQAQMRGTDFLSVLQ